MFGLTKATPFARQMMMGSNNFRMFSTGQKLAKCELTLRTPYRSIYENWSGFSRCYVRTTKGMMCLAGKMTPRVYLLPPGEINVVGIVSGQDGDHSRNTSGNFVHTGGWLFYHE